MDLSYFQSAPRPSMAGGASGYFSTPSDTLDPHLFEGDQLRGAAREAILGPLLRWLSGNVQMYRDWLYVWLAGSGISYQWSAGRGNGDLDVMLGVNMIAFIQDNPSFEGMDHNDISGIMNSALKAKLWPETANTNINGQVYEVTYYLNPGVQGDISSINPYAAYLIYPGDKWVKHPPKLPADPRSLYPAEWFDRAGYDTRRAQELSSRYNKLIDGLNRFPVGSPSWHTAGAGLHATVAEATALFTDIHTGRHAAFNINGKGYGDWTNFRWQQGKASGAIQALHTIVSAGDEARAQEETALYGAPIDSSEVALRRAASVHRNNPLNP